MCSDLAMRSGTGALIAPQHYDAARGEITFETKNARRMTLPVTVDLALILARVPQSAEPTIPYVCHLHPWKHVSSHALRDMFARLRKRLGITKRLTAHDLRRTTAVRTLEVTQDLRKVQALLGHRDLYSTFHYLDHRNTPVEVSTLELAKLPPQTKGVQ